MSENNEIDLSIFKMDKSEIECKISNDNPIKSCHAIRRLIAALKYYSLLNIIQNKQNQNIFQHFISSIYTQFLNDYHHLLREHNSNLHQIHKTMKINGLFGDCDISKCKFTKRHQTQRRVINDNENTMDPNLNFYKTTFDSLHFYLLHLFDVGLRTFRNEIKKNNEKEEEEEIKGDEDEVDDKCFDIEFAEIVKAINNRRDISDSFDRFKSNNKFNICVVTESTGKQYILYLFVLYIIITYIHNIKNR